MTVEARASIVRLRCGDVRRDEVGVGGGRVGVGTGVHAAGALVRTRPRRRRPPWSAQDDAARLQTARAQRARAHARRQRPARGTYRPPRRLVQAARHQPQPRHRIQGRGGHRRRPHHDQGTQPAEPSLSTTQSNAGRSGLVVSASDCALCQNQGSNHTADSRLSRYTALETRGLCTFTAVPRSTQLSALCGTVK